MKKPLSLALLLSASLFVTLPTVSFAQKASKPNVIYIYADDLGFGDLSSYGAKQIETPNLDKLARNGVRFTNAHSTSATCTPSRFALMTGTYPWRQEGTG
ncbi:sulfatase, partial [Sphingobacterium multivorum]